MSIRRTENIVHENLCVPHRVVKTSPLDQDHSLWGALFRKILMVVLSKESTRYALVEQYLSLDSQRSQVKRVMARLRNISELVSKDIGCLIDGVDDFVAIANAVLPNSQSQHAITCLRNVLSCQEYLESFMPSVPGEIQLMTLHKSKGLEFDAVFHLDLYKFILPKYKATGQERIQGLNLHYVGVTRAKKILVLCTSSHRTSSKYGTQCAENSEFLTIHGIESLRKPCPV
ncbi:MAG: ATP-binding domain-containing protein [Caldilineaceae bacterium]|nr:ATP-binding domain-containing protein [Caldilineaceae bacterium]